MAMHTTKMRGLRRTTRVEANAKASVAMRHAPRKTPAPSSHLSSLSRTTFARELEVLRAVQSGGATEATDTIDWDNLGFSAEHVQSTSMFVATATPSADGSQWEWSEEGLKPYQPLVVDPAAQVLNYGQSIFEGMKAQRTPEGDLVLFRPEENAKRMQDGSSRMSMEAPSVELFLKGVYETVRANAAFVPPHGKGSLYIRPLLLGTGPILGLGPAPSFTFIIYCSPVGAYFKGGQLTPIKLKVEEQFHRAAPGGTGNTKCAGNYSPVLKVQLEAKKNGFADVLYLDAVHNTYVEEVSSCNIFAVFPGKKIVTPALKGSILPGVTRKSIIHLARAKGYTVEEGDLSVVDLMKTATECFTTGTAVVLSPVGYLEYGGEGKEFGKDDVALELYEALTGIQQGLKEDPFNWTVKV